MTAARYILKLKLVGCFGWIVTDTGILANKMRYQQQQALSPD